MLPQTEDVARPPDQAGLVERLDLLGTETFDVEGVAADEVPQPLDRLGRTDQPAGAAPDRLALGADGVGIAAWALVGKQKVGRCSCRVRVFKFGYIQVDAFHFK